MNRKIIKYKIEFNHGTEELSENINEDMEREGWELYGFPFMAKIDLHNNDGEGYIPVICQAMVLYDDSTSPKPTFQIGSDVFYD